MFCFNCGKEIPDDTAFCTFCGQAQAADAPAEPPKEAYKRVEPGTIQITHSGGRGLVKRGFYIYINDAKYYTSDYPKGIIVTVAPGEHQICVAASSITSSHVGAFGKTASKAGDMIGGWASVGGGIINLGTKISSGISGKRDTCYRVVKVKAGETVKLAATLKNGLWGPKVNIENN